MLRYWRTIDKNSNMSDIYVYEKYAIVQYNYDNDQKEDCIVCYSFDKNINFSNYRIKGKKIFYQSCKGESWHVMGIRDNSYF
ncbi:MAG: hypothetical protein LBL16_02580 [Endomicrobium sp.]|jgi:Pyruvate/2-oxoacid:ferredoxin oxidoreductase delta subunit|nr:hypothetical protein [Endomicrobium sp.]